MNRINPVLILLIRVILGLVFIYASYDKILDPGKFARDIANYHIIPFGLENSIAIILPWIELLIGLGIILGIFLDGSVFISGGFLVLFILMKVLIICMRFHITKEFQANLFGMQVLIGYGILSSTN